MKLHLPAPSIAVACFLSSPLWLGVAACGGGGGGGPPDPGIRPNTAPVLAPPLGLSGQSPQFSYDLPLAGASTLTFTATDVDGDPLQWSLSSTPAEVVAAGLGFTTPAHGSAFVLEVLPVASTAVARVQLLVEDAFGGAAAIDLTVARTGAPTLTAVSPTSAFGGQPQDLTLQGAAFQLGGVVTTAVTIGGIPATNVAVAEDHLLRCKSPNVAIAAGPTIVGVSHRFGGATLPASAFTVFRYPPRFASTDLRLDATGADALHLDNDGDRMHAVFVTAGRVDHRASIDGGQTWTAAQPLSGAEVAATPQVLVLGDEVLAVWIGDGTAVWLRRSIDGGANWLPAQRIDVATLPETASSRPRLCGDGDHRYLAWLEGNPLQLAARTTVAASADRGAVWTTAQRVDTGAGNQGNCEIACRGAVAWVVGEDDRTGPALRGILVHRTADGGATWGGELRLNRADSAGAAPRLAVDGALVHVVWLREGGVYFNGSADAGANWRQTEVQVRGTEVGTLSAVDVTGDQGRIHVLYTAGGTNLWLSRSTDGATFPDQAAIVTGTLPLAQARVVAEGNYVFTAFRRGDLVGGSAQVVHAVSTDAGRVFGAPTVSGDGIAAQDQVLLRHSGARLLLGWLENRTGTVGAFVNATTP